ncbi:LysR family transcriptional regulator [Massilia oculi]|uniref:LysR family transcriptional regulator n=1 Tax=Massilia oculi TaxID=945844 RepID=UPI001AAF1B87|nr:LysR family transcriptional regulator [Massilia oculi]
MDKLRAMQIFSHVVEARSFAGAARSLSLPRSTISRSIKELEAALGASLLQRTTRTLRLTPNGSLYYDHCRRILREIEGIEEVLSDGALAPRGLLRVDMTASFARALVIPALRDFQARYPDVELSLTLDDRPVELIREGVDCAVRAGTLDASALLVARQIGSFDWIACASPDYLRRHPAPRTLDELAQHDLIGFQSGRDGRAGGWTFDVDGKRRTVDAAPRLTVNETDAYLDCGLAGLGLIRIASYLAAPHLRAGRLVRVLAGHRDAPAPLSLVYPQNRHPSSAVRAFADWLGELYRARAPQWQAIERENQTGEPYPRDLAPADVAP